MRKSIKYKDGSEYIGSLNANKKRHGKGKIIYKSGEKYVGEWKLDQQDGLVFIMIKMKYYKKRFLGKDIFLTRQNILRRRKKKINRIIRTLASIFRFATK